MGQAFSRPDAFAAPSGSHLVERERSGLAVVVDARRGWIERGRELKPWLEFPYGRFLMVAAKAEKLKTQAQRYYGTAAVARHAPGGGLRPCWAETGQGVREIWQAIWKTKNR